MELVCGKLLELPRDCGQGGGFCSVQWKESEILLDRWSKDGTLMDDFPSLFALKSLRRFGMVPFESSKEKNS